MYYNKYTVNFLPKDEQIAVIGEPVEGSLGLLAIPQSLRRGMSFAQLLYRT